MEFDACLNPCILSFAFSFPSICCCLVLVEACIGFIDIYFWFWHSEVSKTEGRVGQTTNVVIGGTVADDSTNEWLSLDQKVCHTLSYFPILSSGL